MKRLGILSASLVVVALGGCGGSSSHGPLAIGAFNPFSGADASFGPEMIGGCEPAVRLINQDGGVLGHKVNCQAVDTRGDPADAVPTPGKPPSTAPSTRTSTG
jgi:ABC-type branched-subunit amino acid transport system substrate-binding protein